MTARREFPTKVKEAAFERAAGRCEKCSARLTVGKFHYDHRIADGIGGEPTLENCQVLCVGCHSTKTRTSDVPRIAKAKRQAASHIGARKAKRPMDGSRASRFKKKLNGEVVLR